MPHHLMNLRHVPDDEAEEIRALFDAHEVAYYETPPSRWGISMGGFWVHDDDEAARARALLDEYQRQRYETQRQAYEEHEDYCEQPLYGPAGTCVLCASPAHNRPSKGAFLAGGGSDCVRLLGR